jgi:predicted GIY-YIG superfamily endonuclease
MPAWFYLLRLRSGTLYPGATTNLKQRYADHLAGRACRTTRSNPPTDLVYFEECSTFVEARRRESQIKGWGIAKKEALISGELKKLRQLAKRKSG